jgi:hypothetical protein
MLFEALARAGRDAGERRVGQVDRELRFRAHELSEAAKERAAPYEDDSTVRDVGRKLRRSGLERLLDGIEDLPYRPLKRFANFVGREGDASQASRDKVSAAGLRIGDSVHL